MLEAKLQKNKLLLLRHIEESHALKSLLDTPDKDMLFCPTVSVNKDGKMMSLVVLRHRQGRMASQTEGRLGGESGKLQLHSSDQQLWAAASNPAFDNFGYKCQRQRERRRSSELVRMRVSLSLSFDF